MKSFSWRWLALVLGLLVVAPAAVTAAEPAGAVERLKGRAAATLAGVERALFVGGQVHVGDRIATGPESRLEVRLTDGATITLGDDSVFTIGGFDTDDRGRVLGLFQGVFLAVTAEIAKASGGGRLTVLTELATIGIRGTTLWGSQEPERLQIALLAGTGVFVEGSGIRVEMTETLTGTSVTPGRPPTAPSRWSDERIEAARRSVAFD